MEKPLVSVIMPVFNAERYILESLCSILNQTYKNIEVIVVDDCSTDSTWPILKSIKDPRVVLIRNDNNSKIVKSLNLGLSKARGEFIARMDADDISLPERISEQVQFLVENNEIDVLGTNIILIDEESRSKGRFFDYPVSPEANRLFLSKYCVLAHPTVMFRKKILEEQGAALYSDKFPYAEDYELWLRLSKNYKISNLTTPLLKYRVHTSSSTHNNYSKGIDSACKAIATHNPLHVNDSNPSFVRWIRRPQEIYDYNYYELTTETFLESLNEAINEGKLDKKEIIEILRWNALFQIRAIFQIYKNIGVFKLSSIKFIFPFKIFKFRVLLGLFKDALFFQRMRRVTTGKF